MYRIEMDGYPLCHYGNGRYGWGTTDQVDSKNTVAGELVEFETRENAELWMKAREQFCRGAVIRSTRGRKKSGNAMSAAERKRRQREMLPGYCADVDLTTCSTTALHAAMQRALSECNQTIGAMLATEYMRRLRFTPLE